MSDLLKVKLRHPDGDVRRDDVDTIVIEHDGGTVRIGLRDGRLEIWTSGPMAVLPGNTIAIRRER